MDIFRTYSAVNNSCSLVASSQPTDLTVYIQQPAVVLDLFCVFCLVQYLRRATIKAFHYE